MFKGTCLTTELEMWEGFQTARKAADGWIPWAPPAGQPQLTNLSEPHSCIKESHLQTHLHATGRLLLPIQSAVLVTERVPQAPPL